MAQTDHDTLEEAREIANEIQNIIVGRHTAAIMYALGMVYACGIARAEDVDVDTGLALFRKIVENEVAEYQRS